VPAVISPRQLSERLAFAGHCFSPAQAPNPATLRTSSEKVVTVALTLSPIIKEAYRQRYFVCLLESEEHPVPVVQYERYFALPDALRRAASPCLFRRAVEESDCDNFVDGPFRWLLRRLAPHRRILLWARPRLPSGDLLEQALSSEPLPELKRWLRAVPGRTAAAGAVVLDLADLADSALLWEVADHVSRSITDFYVSDTACTEVYCLSHLEMVKAIIPHEAIRRKLLEDLEKWADVFEDCSGYECDSDAQWPSNSEVEEKP
jgi:hypothetical protein